MKKIIILLFSLSLIFPAYAVKGAIDGFRNLKWGDGAEKLKNAHCKNSFHNRKLCSVENDNLIFKQAKADSIIYIFQDNQLCSVNLTFSGQQNSSLASKELSTNYNCVIKNYRFECPSVKFAYYFDKTTQKADISISSKKYTYLK